MTYVTEQAAYHAWYGLKPGKLASTLQSISRPTLPAIVCHASRTTSKRPPFDLVAARSPDASQARILIRDRGLVPTCANVRVRSRLSQTGLGSRRQPGNSSQGLSVTSRIRQGGVTRLASVLKTQEHLIATQCFVTATQRGGGRHGVIHSVNDRD